MKTWFLKYFQIVLSSLFLTLTHFIALKPIQFHSSKKNRGEKTKRLQEYNAYLFIIIT